MTVGEALPRQMKTAARRSWSKVPEVTALFWVIKILTTGMGETTSDYLAHTFDPVVAVGIVGIIFAASLAIQLLLRRYRVAPYWFAIVMVSVFGTMAADVLHVGLGVPYAVSTVGFAVILVAIFVTWYACERTLSVHSIHTTRRELFYWATVLTTFALGTAVGDLTAVTLHLGYFASGLMFAVVMAIPAVAYRWLHLNAVVAFWFAYVATRPLGASFADWLGVPPSRGGVDLGTGPVSLALAVVIVCLVAYLGARRTPPGVNEPAEF
jgi:uncharacterized membrane-anchored protein